MFGVLVARALAVTPADRFHVCMPMFHVNAPFSDLRCEHRTKTVPPETHRLVADIDAALEQQVLDLTEQ